MVPRARQACLRPATGLQQAFNSCPHERERPLRLAEHELGIQPENRVVASLQQLKPKTRRLIGLALATCIVVVAGVLLRPKKKEPVDVEKILALVSSAAETAAKSPPPDLLVSMGIGSELTLTGPALRQELTVHSLDELRLAADRIKKPASAQVVRSSELAAKEGRRGLLDMREGEDALCGKRCQEIWEVLIGAGFSRSKGIPWRRPSDLDGQR